NPTAPTLKARTASATARTVRSRMNPSQHANPPKNAIQRPANCRSIRCEGLRGMSDQFMAVSSTVLTNLKSAEGTHGLIELELRQVVFALFLTDTLFHGFLVQHAVLEHQGVHVRGQEAAIGILRCADDRLTAHVEARVHQNGTTCPLMEAIH